jgi:hypothetical protein
MYIYIYTHTHTYTHTRTTTIKSGQRHVLCTQPYVHTYVTCMHTCTVDAKFPHHAAKTKRERSHTYMHTHTCIHIRTYTYMHTYIEDANVPATHGED